MRVIFYRCIVVVKRRTYRTDWKRSRYCAPDSYNCV